MTAEAAGRAVTITASAARQQAASTLAGITDDLVTLSTRSSELGRKYLAQRIEKTNMSPHTLSQAVSNPVRAAELLEDILPAAQRVHERIAAFEKEMGAAPVDGVDFLTKARGIEQRSRAVVDEITESAEQAREFAVTNPDGYLRQTIAAGDRYKSVVQRELYETAAQRRHHAILDNFLGDPLQVRLDPVEQMINPAAKLGKPVSLPERLSRSVDFLQRELTELSVEDAIPPLGAIPS